MSYLITLINIFTHKNNGGIKINYVSGGERADFNTRSILEKTAEAVAILGVIACFALVLVFWPTLPAVIPIHFDIAGHVNGYGAKAELLKPFALGLFIYLLLTAVVVFRGHLISILKVTAKVSAPNYILIRAMLTWFKAEIVWSCALLIAVPINAAMHYNDSLALVTPLPAAVMVLTFLYYVAKLVKPGWIKH